MSKSPEGSYKGTKAMKASPNPSVPSSCKSVLTPAQGLSAAPGPAGSANPTLRSSSSNQLGESAEEQKERDAWQEAGAPKIPAGLSSEEKQIYRRLINIRYRRMNEKPRPLYPKQVVVITDLGKDYDDLAAMIVLKELHRLGLIRLVGFIANLPAPTQRPCSVWKRMSELSWT